MSYGEDVQIALNIQNSFGELQVGSLFFIPFLSENISLKKEPIVRQGLRGVYDDGEVSEGMNTIDGDLEVEAHPILLGVMLKAALGQPTTSAVGSVFSHLFTPRQDDFDQFSSNFPLTVTKNTADGGSAQIFYNMVVSNLELNIAGGELQKAKISLMGGDWTQQAAPAASYLTEVDWTWDVSSIQVGGSNLVGLKDLSFKIDIPNDSSFTLGQGDKFPSHTKRSGFRVVTVDGTLIFDNQTEFQKFINQSDEELIFTLTGETEVGSGYYDVLEIKVPKFRYLEHPIEAGGPGQIEVGVSAKAVYSTSSNTAIQITLQNTQSSY